MKYALSLFLLLMIVSCQNQKMNSEEKFKVDFFEEELNWVIDDPVLNIYFESTECGEWGGDEEYIKVIRKNTQKYKLEYERYQVNWR